MMQTKNTEKRAPGRPYIFEGKSRYVNLLLSEDMFSEVAELAETEGTTQAFQLRRTVAEGLKQIKAKERRKNAK